MGLEKMHRRKRGCCGGIKRPAQMLASMAQPDIDAVMREHVVIQYADERELVVERRRRGAFPGCEITGKLTGKPWPALSAAADHHGIGARCRKSQGGVVEAFDVAVDDDRYRYPVFDRTHRRPVGAPVIELTARATMDRDKRYAGCFGAPRQFRRV